MIIFIQNNANMDIIAPDVNILVNGIKKTKCFGDTIFFNDGDEFDIEFFNKASKTLVPRITINGTKLGSSPVVYAGAKYVLKDYMTESRRFKFTTYNVERNNEDVKRAIEKNGLIEIQCYFERDPIVSPKTAPLTWHDEYTDFSLSLDDPSEMETGKIGRGSESGQRYKSVDVDLESESRYSIVLNLLPESRSLEKINCPTCSKGITLEFTYCPSCGTEIVGHDVFC